MYQAFHKLIDRMESNIISFILTCILANFLINAIAIKIKAGIRKDNNPDFELLFHKNKMSIRESLPKNSGFVLLFIPESQVCADVLKREG